MSYTNNCCRAFLSLLIALCVLSFLPLNGQEMSSLPKDSLVAKGNLLLEKGVALTQVNLDSSLYYKKAALGYFEKANHWESYVDCLNHIAFIYYYKGNFEQSNAHAELAFKKAQQYLEEDNQIYSDVINNLSVFLKQKGDYEQAIQLYEQSLDIQKRVSYDKAAIAISYHNLGNVYRKKGDIEEAIHYYDQALDLRIDTFGQFHIEIARNHLALGNCYRAKEKWTRALQFYQKTLSIANHPTIAPGKITEQVKINAYQNIANYHVNQLDLDSTIYYVNLALALQPDDKSFRKSRSYMALSNIYFEKAKYQQTIEYLKKAKDHSLLEYKAYEKHVAFANLSFQIGKAYMGQKDYTQALSFFQQALTEFTFDFEEKDVLKNPNLNQLYAKSDALNLLAEKANTLYQYYTFETKDEQTLKAAYQTYQLASEIIQSLRENFTATGSKYLLSERALPIYENAIQLAIELNEKTGEQKYLEQAFTFAESNKAVLLLAVLREKMAKGFAGIPDSLLKLEKELKLKSTFYDQKISIAKRKNKTSDLEKIKNWEDTRFALREQYKQLVKSFEKDYPKYFQLKYDNALVQISQFQAKLSPRTLAIEYFVGNEDIYIFGISASNIQVKKIARSEQMLQQVEQLRAYISSPPQSEGAKASLDAFALQAYHLHQQLVAPVLSNTSESIDQLLIIPDDFLSYIPFDLLLTKSPEGMNKTLELEAAYLLQQQAISYHYSASLLLNKRSIPSNLNRAPFVGFAPSFGKTNTASSRTCTEDQLYSLSCNDSEVSSIQQLLKGDAFFRKASSKVQFQDISNNYQIIHLATHACVDDENPMLSKIYFTDDHLTNYDLYNLNLNADLAVLSACNTGSGKLVKGEGVMSLARSFIHAGCPSVLMSLWSVDDCTTSDIMQGFYRQLMDGKNKDEALRQAKLDYLSSADQIHLHPYYWSAFVQFGNYESIDFQYPWGGKWPLIVGAGVILLGLGWWRFGG